MRGIVLLFLCPILVCADAMSEPPTLGYLAAGAQLRKLAGVAGAARQIVVDTVPRGTVVHPARGTVLGRDGEHLVLSDRGDSAVLWREGSIKVLSGLADEQSSTRELETRLNVRAAAISNVGARVATADSEGVRITGTGEHEFPDITSASALAFNGGDLLVADADRALVWRIGETREIVSTDLPDVTALSADAARTVIARANGTILIHDAASGTDATVECRCKPAGLVRLAAAGMWLLTTDPGQPLWVLDVSEAEPRVWFIPALPVPEEFE
jgi:hypothetical protein